MKFGKTLDYSMMLTAPVRESLHWKSYKMPRPDQPDGLRRMPGPVAGLHGDRVGEPRHQAGPSVGRARTTSCLTSRSPGPAKPRDARCQESRMPERFEAAVRGGTDNFTDVIADKAKPSRCCAMVLGSLEDLGKAAKVSRSESSQQQTSAVSKQQQ